MDADHSTTPRIYRHSSSTWRARTSLSALGTSREAPRRTGERSGVSSAAGELRDPLGGRPGGPRRDVGLQGFPWVSPQRLGHDRVPLQRVRLSSRGGACLPAEGLPGRGAPYNFPETGLGEIEDVAVHRARGALAIASTALERPPRKLAIQRVVKTLERPIAIG